jgi:CheY-like chemotaxis protein
VLQVQAHNSPLSETGFKSSNDFLGTDPKKAEVLVVDDDPDLLEVTRFVLESEGFGVETAKNGEEALNLLRAGRRPAIVLLDLMMPVMNGWQFLDEIAKLPSLKDIPVAAVTAAGAVEVPGTVAVLRKPIDLGLLIETVERFAREDE